jgi:hypothetical protein
MDTPDNGTRWIIHRAGTRRINLRGGGAKLPPGEWWNGGEWVQHGGNALALTDIERDCYTLPDGGEWQMIFVELLANT